MDKQTGNDEVEFNLLDKIYNLNQEQDEELDEELDEEPTTNPVDNKQNNLDDYHIPENLKQSENGFTFLNVFMCYYKKLFYKTEQTSMFEDIDYNNIKSTNRMMEFLYSEVFKYKKYQDDDDFVALYEPGIINVDDCKELYALTIDGKYNKVCRFLVPIITFVSENYEWNKIDWAIIPLK